MWGITHNSKHNKTSLISRYECSSSTRGYQYPGLSLCTWICYHIMIKPKLKIWPGYSVCGTSNNYPARSKNIASTRGWEWEKETLSVLTKYTRSWSDQVRTPHNVCAFFTTAQCVFACARWCHCRLFHLPFPAFKGHADRRKITWQEMMLKVNINADTSCSWFLDIASLQYCITELTKAVIIICWPSLLARK